MKQNKAMRWKFTWCFLSLKLNWNQIFCEIFKEKIAILTLRFQTLTKLHHMWGRTCFCPAQLAFAFMDDRPSAQQESLRDESWWVGKWFWKRRRNYHYHLLDPMHSAVEQRTIFFPLLQKENKWIAWNVKFFNQ